jgi:ATP-dependent Lhr-like helicase
LCHVDYRPAALSWGKLNHMHPTLSQFDPQIASWFDDTYGPPTDIQQQAWPRISSGEHLLITAPTGSGKTLTAFLWAINQFITGKFETGATRILYISPLKALNNDIERNLNEPLAALRRRAEAESLTFPDIRVQTRSGDTEQTERRRMLRHPPEILITTPESLNILLTSKSGVAMLRNIETVILDEIHGVVSDKRGVYLMSAIERLVPLSGEFQRISLSATVKPMALVADFVAGYERLPDNSFRPRKVQCLASTAEKHYDVTVSYPETAANRPLEEKVWDALANEFVRKIRSNTSTLLFVNSRTLAETITHKINTAAEETLAYAHHGSLSREIRLDVEQRLKNGELAAIVATGTLEMGIDIGALDEVLLIQAPEGISSAVQRIGRAGHGVGEVSRCTIYPTHPLDFIESAVLGKAVLEADIEPTKTISCPLDVLAQIIISMASTETWPLDELYLELKRSTPFQVLRREQFDLVINMLNGRYGENRIRELRPKVVVDQAHNTIESRRGATMALYLSGGVIPDRGYFQIRHQESNARIGELDEEFVWEAYVGKVFAFGTQHWQIKKITHNDVIVAPARPTAIAPPFWKSEGINRNFHYATRIASFLEDANIRIESPDYSQYLVTEHHLEPGLSSELVNLLQRQKTHTGAPLPHRHHILIEQIQAAAGHQGGYQVVLHTGWGSRVNRPLALAMEAAWYEKWHEQPEVFVTDQCLVVQLIEGMNASELLELVPASQIENLLHKRLEGSGFFGARFRENAGRALLLSKGKFNERKPLWMSRLQSQKLLDVVSKYEDFPILLETWRTCLQDEFDIDNLRLVLNELATGQINVTEVQSKSPSPFAQTVAWDQVNEYMYMTDKPRSSTSSNLSRELLESLVFQPALRPAIPEDIVRDFVMRRQRTFPGYEPQSDLDLVEWVKERTLIPRSEWWADTDSALSESLARLLEDKLHRIQTASSNLIIATEDKSWVEQQLHNVSPTLIGNWMQYYGPLTLDDIVEKLGTSKTETESALVHLIGDSTLIVGQLVKNKEQDKKQIYYCDAANFEALLRFVRQAARISFEPKPLNELTPFLYHWQTRYQGSDPEDNLASTLDLIQCLPQAPAAWEQHILPSRIPKYDTRSLDLVMQTGSVHWIGTERQQIQFCYADNLSMLDAMTNQRKLAENTDDEDETGTKDLFTDIYSRYDFLTLLDKSGLNSTQLTSALWQEVWHRKVSNDTFAALRSGIAAQFQLNETPPSSPSRHRRAGFRNWKRDIPFAGDWYQLRYSPVPTDSIETEERNKDRVRLLLDRYGLLFRELLLQESDEFRWSSLFRSMRLMELSGELYSGYFFTDIPGPQFIAPAALAALTSPSPTLAQHTVFWINATDPISSSGLPGLNLPRRVPGNYLVFEGNQLRLVVEQQGKKLTFHTSQNDPRLLAYFEVFHHLLNRAYQPRQKITLELINGESARDSAFLTPLSQVFDLVRDHKTVYLQKKFN